ncbi:hypothetical protein KJ815_13760, partial [bacterium]|nr:hypothetical protein [bacterium]
FDIKRGIAGLPDNIIASVPANTTTYTDTLTEIGFYYYRVRSANAFGESAWALPVEAEYRFCSDGLIPVCVGNYWEYDVDSADVHSSIRRRVAEDVTFLSGDDYYRIIQSPLFGGQPDSLYYLRNSIGQGTLMEKHPLPATPAPEIMFRYPTGVSGSYYYALGDCVVVLNAYPGISIPIRDTTYTGVVSYQRFFRNGRSIQYWIRPNDVGIVREVENRGGVPPVTIVREVMRYMILNQ